MQRATYLLIIKWRILYMYIALWERYFDVVLIQGVVDALQDVAYNIYLLHGIYPAEQLEIDAAVAELGEDGANLFLLVDVGMLKIDNSILYHAAHLFHVGAVGHVERYQRQHISMIAGEVLIVLCEQLRVLESDDRAIDSFYHGAGIADGTYLTLGAVALYPVAYLDASRHERDAIVDVLQDVLHGETDTGRETS